MFLSSSIQEEPKCHAHLRRYRSLPQNVRSNLKGYFNPGEIQTPSATATIPWLPKNAVSAVMNQQELGTGFSDTAFKSNTPPIIEFPSIKSAAIRQANSLDFQPTGHFVGEGGACLLSPALGSPFLEHSQSISDSPAKQKDIVLLRSLFGSQHPHDQNFATAFLQAAPNTEIYPVQGSELDDLEFLRAANKDDDCGEDANRGMGADPSVVLSLWEAYVWHATEKSKVLQSLMLQVDWAMKQCSSSSVMFTRCVALLYPVV
jgi:hypothetical protein